MAVVDIPNAFAQFDLIKNEKSVKIIMSILVDIMIRIILQVYTKYVTSDKEGNTVL